MSEHLEFAYSSGFIQMHINNIQLKIKWIFKHIKFFEPNPAISAKNTKKPIVSMKAQEQIKTMTNSKHFISSPSYIIKTFDIPHRKLKL